ncbi:MAG: hypothetical protein ACI9CF_000430 [Candidatus Omnitrophota bacterium]|jgi:hypothetical protein
MNPPAKGFSLLHMDPASRVLGDPYAACFARLRMTGDINDL